MAKKKTASTQSKKGVVKTIKLVPGGFVLHLAQHDNGSFPAAMGMVESKLMADDFKEPENTEPDSPVVKAAYRGAAHALESFVLSLACAGYDVKSKEFSNALTTSIEAISENLEGEILG